MGASSGVSRLYRFDQALRAHHGVRILVGVDEAGRGPLAGPVVAAAVALAPKGGCLLRGVRDSKALSPSRRLELFAAIRRHALGVGVGWASPVEIDRHNILQASLLAMRRAVLRLRDLADPAAVLVVVDGNRAIPGLPFPQKPLVRGDAFSQAVAGASIVAKVVRDRWMGLLHQKFPHYGFSIHKGYGTAEHLKALDRFGPSPAHRRSFSPVAQAKLPFDSAVPA